ncbi:MAG: hypothetical protein Q4Q22_03780 [Methanosphaera sp.]|nr:hypothetical protein [Methanosphaera sp.]
MIDEISLKDSRNYQNYMQNTDLYNRGIHADTCIIVDSLETYYDRKNQIVYVENYEYFNEMTGNVERKGQITKKMLKELMDYLDWNNWSISIYYYTYEKAIIMIKQINDNQSSLRNLEMDVLNDDLLQNDDKKVPTLLLTSNS